MLNRPVPVRNPEAVVTALRTAAARKMSKSNRKAAISASLNPSPRKTSLQIVLTDPDYTVTIDEGFVKAAAEFVTLSGGLANAMDLLRRIASDPALYSLARNISGMP